MSLLVNVTKCAQTALVTTSNYARSKAEVRSLDNLRFSRVGIRYCARFRLLLVTYMYVHMILVHHRRYFLLSIIPVEKNTHTGRRQTMRSRDPNLNP